MRSTCASLRQPTAISIQLLPTNRFVPILLYRINGFQIDLAPLRERPEDIEPLARHLLNDVGGTTPPELEPEALDALRSYSWPGNVRQLKNCLERAVILSNNGRITINELPPEVVRPSVPAAVFAGPASQPGAAVDFSSGASSFAPARVHRPLRCATSSANRFFPRSNKLAGIAARPPRSSASLLQLSIAACATTTSNTATAENVAADFRG